MVSSLACHSVVLGWILSTSINPCFNLVPEATLEVKKGCPQPLQKPITGKIGTLEVTQEKSVLMTFYQVKGKQEQIAQVIVIPLIGHRTAVSPKFGLASRPSSSPPSLESSTGSGID